MDTNTLSQASMRIRPYLVPVVLSLSFVALGLSPVSAQRVDPSGQTRIGGGAHEMPRPMQGTEPALHPVRGIAGGVLAGGLGLGLGLIGGANISSGPRCPGEDCGIVGAIVGATVGESVGLALGTHFAGRGQGNVFVTTLTSTAIGMAGVAAAFAVSNERAAPYIIGITPIIQSAVLLMMER
jgi:hypothetical protein